MMKFETVIGLEIHIQLNTHSKVFCADPQQFDAAPNTLVSPISLGLPGTLPKLNAAVVQKAVRLALSLEAEVQPVSIFERKNYFYPDLPKGYQITQNSKPYCVGGSFVFHSGGTERRIRLHHIHIEEDAGKSLHEASENQTLLDYNRAGTALLEMVTEPDFRSGQEVADFLDQLQQWVRYLDISDANMEEGSMRCDCNVSVRPQGAAFYGTRCEIKNMNSKKFAQQAIDYESSRQIQAIHSGERIIQSTLSFDPATGRTQVMRQKENENDYKYFPDPDLPALFISEDFIVHERAKMPLTPPQVKAVLTEKYQLSEMESTQLMSDRIIADRFRLYADQIPFFSELAQLWIQKCIPVTQDLNQLGTQLSIQQYKDFFELQKSGRSHKSILLAQLLPELWCQPEKEVLKTAIDLGLIFEEVLDLPELDAAIQSVIEAFPEKLTAYRKGQKGLSGFFIGQTKMKLTTKIDPQILKERVEYALNS